jgi:hypothetical protein
MMVLIMERVSASTRGELTRWLLEPRGGVCGASLGVGAREAVGPGV